MSILKEWIENTIENIKSPNGSEKQALSPMSGLRNLQLRINPLILANVDPRTKFISYFLSCYVDSILMDLCGDTPDDEDGKLKKVRDEFFKEIIQNFEKLGCYLNNDKNPFPILEEFVTSYAKAVNKLNYLDNQ